MFKDVISRAKGAPWGTTGLTSETWLLVPLERVDINTLIATQDGIYFEPLIRHTLPSYSGDLYPHVVVWKNKNYLEDGHHRAVIALLSGETWIMARVLEMSGVE